MNMTREETVIALPYKQKMITIIEKKKIYLAYLPCSILHLRTNTNNYLLIVVMLL